MHFIVHSNAVIYSQLTNKIGFQYNPPCPCQCSSSVTSSRFGPSVCFPQMAIAELLTALLTEKLQHSDLPIHLALLTKEKLLMSQCKSTLSGITQCLCSQHVWGMISHSTCFLTSSCLLLQCRISQSWNSGGRKDVKSQV